MAEDRRSLFDAWAESYDSSVTAPNSFPLAGHAEVLARTFEVADVQAGMSVLDLGTGTGALAALFHQRECEVWATDFSERMLERARMKLPRVHFALADLRCGPAADFPRQYDRTVSAYALHHLDLEGKLELIEKFVRDHLLPDGRLVLADIAFASASERSAAHQKLARQWDESEFYWAADETLIALRQRKLEASFEQISFCAGVFTITELRDNPA